MTSVGREKRTPAITNGFDWSLKLDHVLNNHHKISGTYVNNDRSRLRFGGGTPQLAGVPIPGPAATGDKTQSTPGFIVRIAEDWTLGANKVNHFAFGYNQFRNANLSNANIAGTDWASELGLKNVGSHAFPVIRWGGLVTPIQTGGYPTLGMTPGTTLPTAAGSSRTTSPGSAAATASGLAPSIAGISSMTSPWRVPDPTRSTMKIPDCPVLPPRPGSHTPASCWARCGTPGLAFHC